MKLVNFLVRLFKGIVFGFYILFFLFVCYGTYLNLVDVFHTSSVLLSMDIDIVQDKFFNLVAVLFIGVLSVIGAVVAFTGAVVLYDKLFYLVKKEESDLNVS